MNQKSVICRTFDGAFFRMAYTEWGAADAPVLICVHGLTRNSRDFDALAERFSADYRVICPDIAGRGDSDWLPNPDRYGYPQYLADLTALIARLDVAEVNWLGTSMGALLGMIMAAGGGSPVNSLLMNDAGPLVPKEALKRIGEYLSQPVDFADQSEAEAYFRRIHAPFGNLTDDQWARFTEHSVRPGDDGRVKLKYDPAIAKPFAGAVDRDMDLWPVWDAIKCPVTVLRGAQSDLLSAETAREMTARGPKATVREVADCGHAPALLDAGQLDLVAAWLEGKS